jgi:hypothetical protein
MFRYLSPEMLIVFANKANLQPIKRLIIKQIEYTIWDHFICSLGQIALLSNRIKLLYFV